MLRVTSPDNGAIRIPNDARVTIRETSMMDEAITTALGRELHSQRRSRTT